MKTHSIVNSQNIPIKNKPRGYDSPELYRRDTFVRIKILEGRIKESVKKINEMLNRANVRNKDEDCD